MRGLLIAALGASVLPAAALRAEALESWSERGVNVGLNAVAEMLYSASTRHWPARVDLGVAVELDLGALIDWTVCDHLYAFALPTVVWGEEEQWHWRAKLYVAWLKWDGSEHFNVLAGLYDPTWDFHALPSTAPFMRLPSRIGGEFSPGSPALLDLFPLAAPGLRVEVRPRPALGLQAAALFLDDRYAVHGRPALTARDSGLQTLFLVEANWTHAAEAEEGEEVPSPSRFGIGAWLMENRSSAGAYAFVDAMLWRERDDPTQGAAIFSSASVAGGRERATDWRFAGGMTWRGAWPGRERDITAFAIIRESSADTDRPRTALEWLHRVPLTPATWCQFTVQHQGRDDWRVGVTVGLSL